MRSFPARARNVGVALAVSVLLSACVVTASPYGVYAGPAVAVAPPAPQVEYYGAPPQPGYFWIGGYWNWAGGRYGWVPGRWSAPRQGYRWVPHTWVHGGNGWHMQEGHWAHR
jgi:WXXGXW repeat (2 copies)